MKTAFVLSVVVLMVLAACATKAPISSEGSVSWEAAVQLLKDGKVRTVMQSHNLQVDLVLKDGNYIHTTEPSIDAIISEIRACDSRCEGITIGTE